MEFQAFVEEVVPQIGRLNYWYIDRFANLAEVVPIIVYRGCILTPDRLSLILKTTFNARHAFITINTMLHYLTAYLQCMF